MNGIQLDILYEDNHLLAVNKPAGLPTMGASLGKPSLVILARQYIKDRYDKPGNVYLGVVSRLDAVATGVVVFARTSKAADRLTQLFANQETRKTYWAMIEQAPDPPEGTCVDWLLHDDRLRRVIISTPHAGRAKEARLAFTVLDTTALGALLEIQLETGRKHQIRVQLAHRGWPIIGDVKYGSLVPFPSGIALHARKLEFVHPVRNVPVTLEARLPSAWRRLGVDR